MRRVVHGGQARPDVRPTVHVLMMRPLQVLQVTEFPLVVELPYEQIFARIENRLSHHVLEAGSLHQIDDLAAFLNRHRHRNRAHDVLACLECGNRECAVRPQRSVDVHEIDRRVGQNV